jgi:hypothetical protein
VSLHGFDDTVCPQQIISDSYQIAGSWTADLYSLFSFMEEFANDDKRRIENKLLRTVVIRIVGVKYRASWRRIIRRQGKDHARDCSNCDTQDSYSQNHDISPFKILSRIGW